MADLDSQVGVAYQPQSAAVDTCVITTASGQEIELKQMLIELSYFEDIYTFAVSGSIVIRDGQGLVDNFQLTGNESLELNFGRVSGSKSNITGKFRVYKLGNRKPVGNQNSEFFTLYFCSPELIRSEETKISKSYSGQPINKTVVEILQNEVKTDKKLFVEKTLGVYDLNPPRVKPFEAISWLSSYARPTTQDLAGADMLFFENKHGFNFMSLRTMFSKDSFQTYNYQQNNIESTLQDKSTSVLQYDVVKSFDMLNEISSGMFANRLISVDPLTRSYKVTDFDYKDYIKKNKPENGGAVLPPNKDTNTKYESVVKVVIGNSAQYQVGYINNKPGSVAHDIYVENYIPNRTAQIALANYIVLKIAVPGDPALVAGMTIDFNLYTFGSDGTNRQLDKQYSGKYLINAVRHTIQSQGVYQTIMEIAKESYDRQLQPVKASNE